VDFFSRVFYFLIKRDAMRVLEERTPMYFCTPS